MGSASPRCRPLPTALLIGFQALAVAVYVSSRIWGFLESNDRWALVRSSRVDLFILCAAAALLLFRFEVSNRPVLKVSAVYVAVLQAVLLVRLGIEAVRLNLMLSQSRLHPTRVLAITFMGLIILGTAALALPKATHPHVTNGEDFCVGHHLLNCAFTATSATCVTGLTVMRTGRDFTFMGQVIILVLIQAGGLGIMMFGSVAGLLIGKQLSLRQSLALQDSLSHRTIGQMRRVIVFILVSTFIFETLGAVTLYYLWGDSGTTGDRIFSAVFHSISAFCNAGFGLSDDSLISHRRSLGLFGCIMPLIVFGGLGFPVLRDLFDGTLASVRRRLGRRRGTSYTTGGARRYRLSIHTRLVLHTSAALIVGPTIMFFFFESLGTSSMAGNATMRHASPVGRMVDSLFLAVTCRTAGFNTVAMDETSMTPGSHMLAAILMFVGGSPGSTAGGVKTIGIAILLLSIWSTLRGRNRVEIFGRTIPDTVVRRAGVVVIVMFGVVSLVTLTLCATENTSLRAALFEAVSACGTVGLSTGLTPDLTIPGRVVIISAMFAGRLGPLTLLIVLAGRTPPARYDYPNEEVMIG